MGISSRILLPTIQISAQKKKLAESEDIRGRSSSRDKMQCIMIGSQIAAAWKWDGKHYLHLVEGAEILMIF
jgi:hypothetical protein